jgi:hypothetical protein
MKKLFFVFTFLLIISSLSSTYAQYDRNWAIGFRVGEPLGINIRKYINDGDNALDLNIGTYGFIYNKDVKYNGGFYHDGGLMIQGHYLWVGEIAKKDWAHYYLGFGGQINNRKHYEDTIVPSTGKTEQIGTSKISMGGSGTAGLEFKLENNLGIFVDAGLYIEVIPATFYFNPQVSAGVRINLVK